MAREQGRDWLECPHFIITTVLTSAVTVPGSSNGVGTESSRYRDRVDNRFWT
jgi:hypothetical protein